MYLQMNRKMALFVCFISSILISEKCVLPLFKEIMLVSYPLADLGGARPARTPPCPGILVFDDIFILYKIICKTKILFYTICPQIFLKFIIPYFPTDLLMVCYQFQRSPGELQSTIKCSDLL